MDRNHPNKLDSDSSFILDTVPRVVNFLPREDNLQVKAFQCSAFPARIVEAIHSNDIPRNLVLGATQWRLDFPRPKKLINDERVKAALSVAESLLTRGATPYCLPRLESIVDVSSLDCDAGRLEEALSVVASSATCQFEAIRFESEEEGKFYKLFTIWNETLNSQWNIIPQVFLSSLSPNNGTNGQERVDFTLTRFTDAPIVVEIDGNTHLTTKEKDHSRDKLLTKAGVKVIRIPASDIRKGSGHNLDKIMHPPEIVKTKSKRDETPLIKALRLHKMLHAVQLSILESIRGGWLTNTSEEQVIAVIFPEKLADYFQVENALKVTSDGLEELLNRLADLFGLPRLVSHINIQQANYLEKQPLILITPGSKKYDSLKELENVPQFFISDMFFPGEISVPASAANPLRVDQPKKEDVKWFLNYLFRKEDFWEGQWEALERTLKGQDSVVLLPTGSGKSIAFQLAALLLPGRCIVVDPILSLIDDQIDNLRRCGIDRCIGISSEIASWQRRELILGSFSSGHFLFTYVAPERFQTTSFREHLRALTAMVPVSVVAVDEAHCVTSRTQEQEKLKESENRFSKAFHSSPVGLSISRINDGTFIDVNQSFLNMFGYLREELIGQKATELNIYANPIERKEIVHQLEQHGKILNYEVTARTRTGAEINALTSAEKIEINSQAHIIWTTIDITDRKKTEKEVFQLNRELKAINECDQVIVHANDEQTLLSDVCRILCTSAGYRTAWVSSVERDEAKSLHPLAYWGDEEYITHARITWADNERGRGPTGLAARNNKTYFFQDFTSEPAAAPWREAALLRGFRSSTALPLADEDGRVFEVLTLYSTEPNYFNAAEVKLLEMLAGDLAFGINGLREREKRKSAEAEILHLASFPELNPNPIIELDFSGNVKYANPAAKRDFPLITLGHKQAFLMDLFDAIQKDKTHSVTKDINIGTSWYEQTIVYVPVTKSSLIYDRNITSRKIAEESLRQSEEKFRSMNFTMNEGICLHEIIYDESGKGVDYRILDINPAYEQITGLTREKTIGKKASELYGTGTPPYFDIYERVAASGKPESFETYFPPMQKYFSISAFSPQKGRFGTVFNDITGRRRAEQEKQHLMDKITDAQKQTSFDLAAMTMLQKLGTLSLQEGKLEPILIEIVDAAIAISGADFGNIQLLDPETHDLKIVAYRGYPGWWLDFWSTVSKGKGTCGTALERGERVIVEDVEQSPIFIGTPALDIQLKADIRGIQSTPLVSRSGKTLGMFSTQYKTPHRPDARTLRLLDLLARQAADIIDSKQVEDQLKQRTIELEASNKELEAFSYSVSHDLRAPLRSITGFSNVLLEDYSKELDDEGKSYLKKISDSGELMGQLMDDLLKLSRVTRSDLTMEKLDLSNMAQKIISDLVKEEPKRKVKVTIAPDITANGDKNLLGLALQNLLGNSWKYTGKTAEPRIEMGTVEHDGKMAYFVRDNGAGFDMTYANKLFMPFQRLHKATEFAGTGIGLATVQRIIRRHGGEVWAEAKVGEGATFYFTLG